MQIKSKNSLLVLLFLPVLASAAGIGKITVMSALGEPLKAELEVFVSEVNELDLAVARVGSMQDYAAAGIPDAFVNGVNANIVKKSNGRYFIELQGNQVVNDPYLELLVKLDTKTSNLMRQYTVLLDPPLSNLHEEFTSNTGYNEDDAIKKSSFKKSNRKDIAKSKVPEGQVDSRSTNVNTSYNPVAEVTTQINPPKLHLASGEISPSDETYTAQNGDVFGKIAQRYQPEGVPLVKVMAAFYALNKQAFVNGDIQKLKTGSVIRIPDQDSLNNSSRLKSLNSSGGQEPQVSLMKPLKEVKEPPAQVITPVITPQSKEIAKLEPTTALDKNVSQNPTKGDPNYVLKVSPGDTSVTVNERVSRPVTDLANASKNGHGDEVNVDGLSKQKSGGDSQVNAQQPKKNGLAVVKNSDASHTSFAETLKGYWNSILIVLGLALAASLAWFWYNKKHKSGKDLRSHFGSVFGEEILPIEPPSPIITSGSAESRDTKFRQQINNGSSMHETLLTESTFESQFGSQADKVPTKSIDPIVEAELYMTYGRHKQAETILTSVETPYKLELSLGLLKIYADRKDKAAFERIVHSIHDDLSSGSIEDAMIWSKVVALGATIDPDNPLYAGASKVNKLSAKERASAAERAMRENLMPFEPDSSMLESEGIRSEDFSEGLLAQSEPLLHSEPTGGVGGMEQKESSAQDAQDQAGEFEQLKTPEKTNEIEFTFEDLKVSELSSKVSAVTADDKGTSPSSDSVDEEIQSDTGDAHAFFSKLRDGSKET